MTLATGMEVPAEGIAGICRKYSVKELAVFGSAARGEMRPDSDVDILIVLDRISSYGAEIERTSELISRVSLESGYSISRVFVSQSAWLSEASAFLDNVREEAIAS